MNSIDECPAILYIMQDKMSRRRRRRRRCDRILSLIEKGRYGG
jgi:hypothetical protein